MTAAVTERGPLLYQIPEACALLRMSRTEIYEQIKAGRLHTIHQGCAALEQEIARRLALQPHPDLAAPRGANTADGSPIARAT